MKVSVITPVYNASEFLENAIESILSQDINDIEIICVNDGSTDNSLKLLKELQKRDNRIKVFSQKNQGSGAARNLAIREAKGEFITFMDADDWYPSQDILSSLYSKAKHYRQKIAGGSFVRYYENGKIESEFSGIYSAYKFHKEEVIQFKDYQFDYGYHRFLYDRQMLIDHNIFFPDYRRFQDPPFFLRAMMVSQSFISLDKAVYAYRKGHQSVDWDIPKLKGLLAGLLENLIMSKKYKLARLHSILIDRVEKDFFKDIKKNFNSPIVFFLLKRFLYSIDTELLRESGVEFSIENMHVYNLIKQYEKK